MMNSLVFWHRAKAGADSNRSSPQAAASYFFCMACMDFKMLNKNLTGAKIRNANNTQLTNN